MTATEDYQRQRMVAQTNVYAIPAATATSNGTAQILVADDATGSGQASAGADTRRHTIDTWLGFLGSAKPNFIDTSLLGNVRISITLAPGDILGGVNGHANANRIFTVKDQAFSIRMSSASGTASTTAWWTKC
eukprot:SAG11_NODE_3893_length_2161_cov_53.741028_3_plen_133_part_00